MQTAYVGSQPVEFGDLKPCTLLGTLGPTSYSQTAGDPVSNPAPGDYISVPFGGLLTVSLNYIVNFAPLAVNDIRAGSVSSSQSGWVAYWYVASTGAPVPNATNLSAESLEFGALITER